MGKEEENNAIELLNSEGDKGITTTSPATVTVHVVNEDDEDPDIDMDITVADINRALVRAYSVL